VRGEEICERRVEGGGEGGGGEMGREKGEKKWIIRGEKTVFRLGRTGAGRGVHSGPIYTDTFPQHIEFTEFFHRKADISGTRPSVQMRKPNQA
jgi:hypothetical protein